MDTTVQPSSGLDMTTVSFRWYSGDSFKQNTDDMQGVGIVNGTSATTTSSTVSISTTTQSTTSLPYPTQSGIVSNCDKFVEAVSGDYCSIFASNNGITAAQLYAWNPILGSNGQNCSNAFFAGYDYCVRIFHIYCHFDTQQLTCIL